MLLLVMSGLQCLGVEAVQPPQRKLGIVQPHLKRLGTKDSLPSPALVLSRRRDLAIRSSSRGEGADSPSRWLTRVRGGVQPAKSKSKVKATAPTATGNKIRYAGEAGTKQKVKEWYKATPIITRVQLSTSLLLTALGLVAIDPSYFLLDPVKIVTGLQLWRPFTAAAFMGPPSMSWVSNLYFLHQYGMCRGTSYRAWILIPSLRHGNKQHTYRHSAREFGRRRAATGVFVVQHCCAELSGFSDWAASDQQRPDNGCSALPRPPRPSARRELDVCHQGMYSHCGTEKHRVLVSKVPHDGFKSYFDRHR